MAEIDEVGTDWLINQVLQMPDSIERVDPVRFNEENRYLPQGVSPRPGYIRYDLFPFLREIIECFSPFSPVREVNLMKGVQTGYTTLLESILLYIIGYIKTAPAMFFTAEKELATARVENNIIPMINESGFSHLIRSSDEGNNKKTGKTKNFLQWDGGGNLLYAGASNAKKMRQNSAPYLLKDELDGWKRSVGEDGNSDTLTDARARAYWGLRKILRGSTPLLEPSMIAEAHARGDQRKYLVLCKACSFPQELRWETANEDTGVVGGFQWETEGGILLLDSVSYNCQDCGEPHFEHDKERLFAAETGAHWKPTAPPKEPGIRSYHLPAFYSPFGFGPWSKCVADYLDSFDPVTRKVISISKYQEFYNNTLGMPFKVQGARIRFAQVSAHRRACYRLGEIPNTYASKHSGSAVMFLTTHVDVHKENLAVSVMGWARSSKCYVIDYWRIEARKTGELCEDGTVWEGRDEKPYDCELPECPAWDRLRWLIESKQYSADDGKQYCITMTSIDAGWANATVVAFCAEYALSGAVFPSLGGSRPTKNQKISEFAEFKTQSGTIGYRIIVDHYKDRLAPVLRREWIEDSGAQKEYQFNAPVDISDKQLKELTVEKKREKVNDKGETSHEWYRPGNARNELWDLLVYGNATVEILAWKLCIQHFELETVNWPQFWDYLEENKLYFTEPTG